MNALFPAVIDDFCATVDRAAERLAAIPDADAGVKPAPDQWSRKEIIGHLIDSACNNHGRFVRAQLQDDLIFSGYEQDAWVRVQRYQDQPWEDLVALWRLYNHQLARIIERADADELSRPRGAHNLDQIAWAEVSASDPATLEFFIRDYVAHLKHHLRQAQIL